MRSGGTLDRLPLAILTLLLVGPVIAGLAWTVLPALGYFPAIGATQMSLEPIKRLLEMPGLVTSALLSFGTGLTASIISLLLVIWFFAGWYGTRTFRQVSRFLSPLLSVPHAAAAIGLAFLIAPSGFLVRLASPWATGWDRPPDLLILNDPYGIAMTIGLIAKEVPFLFLMLLAALNRPHISQYAKAGASFGYGRMTAFAMLILPQVYPLVRLPVFAVIAYSTSVVDVAILLGPTTPAPLAPRLLTWMNDPELSSRLVASAGALLQLGVSLTALTTYLALEHTARKLMKPHLGLGRRGRRDHGFRLAGLTVMSGLVAMVMMSLLVLFIWSGAGSWWFPAPLPQTWSLLDLLDATVSGAPALWMTLAIGLLTALIATGLVLWLLEARQQWHMISHRLLKSLIFLPLLVPQIAFLFGLQILFLSLGLDGSFLAVILVHMVFVLPYAFLALADPWSGLDPRFAKVATSLGASRIRVFFRIKLPVLIKPVLVAAAVGLAVSVGQYLPTLLIGAGRIVTITTESVALASGGDRQASATLALLQLFIPLCGFMLAAATPAFLFRNRAALNQDAQT